MCLLLLLVLQGLHHCVPEDTGQEDLPGHLQPLGAHMPPEQVRRLSHLPSPREFQEKFVAPKTPVIFDGAMRNSPTCVNWQDDEYIRYVHIRKGSYLTFDLIESTSASRRLGSSMERKKTAWTLVICSL